MYDEKKTRLDKIEDDINQLTEFLQVNYVLAKSKRSIFFINKRCNLGHGISQRISQNGIYSNARNSSYATSNHVLDSFNE